jgi:hypothetical protein
MEKEQIQKEEEERDVLEGGILTTLFPGYGGAGYRGLIRLIIVAIIIYFIWRFFTKTESGKNTVEYFKNILSNK